MSKIPVLIPKGKKVLLYDGVCNLCNGFVQFLLKRDRKGIYLYASLQSEIGQQLLKKHQVDVPDLSTVVLIDGNRWYAHSDVPLQIACDLGGWLYLLRPLAIIPFAVRNKIYDWVAANRYRWFGKKEQCMLPRPEWRSRFLDVL